jgi:hypothetical protein
MFIDINKLLYGYTKIRTYLVVIAVIILAAILYSSIKNAGTVAALKKEQKELKQEIKANNKMLDNLSVELANKTSELNVIKQDFLEAELNLKIEKSKTLIINKKYEKILYNYNILNNDDKWKYFRSIVSE